MSFHLSERAEDLMRQGMPPEAARREAARRFGNIDVRKEYTRDKDLVLWLESLMADLRYAWRGVRGSPGFAIITIVSLGLGIGAATTMFSAINGVLLTPLPYAAPARLVMLRESNVQQTVGRAGVSAPNYIDWRFQTRTLEGLAAYRPWGYVLTGNGDAERVSGARVSANLFTLFGINTVLGRAFVAGEDQLGNHKVALISETLWRGRFGGDSAAVGRPILLDGESYNVVGVVPSGFALPDAQVWVPIAFQPWELMQRGSRALTVIGRLKPGVTAAGTREDMSGIAAELERQYPGANSGWGLTVTPLHQEIAGDSRTPLLLLFGAVGAVLAIACAHLAILLLARSAARAREIAVRMAIGAGRGRIVQQLVTENVLMSLCAGAVGLIVASAGTGLLANLGPAYLPRSSEIRIDLVVITFALIASLAAAAALAWTAALAATTVDLSQSIRQTASSRSLRHRRFEFRDLAVVGQFALTLALLASAGLLIRSFQNVRSVDLGFDPRQVLVAGVSLGGKYQQPEQRFAFFQDLLARLEAETEVRSAGLVSHLPLAPGALTADLTAEGRAASPSPLPTVRMNNVTAGYFRTMSMPLLQGRTFSEADRLGSAPVVIVDDVVARSLWGNDGAIGRRVRLGSSIGADSSWREVIGVVASVRAGTLEGDPTPTIYVHYLQNPWPTMSLVAGTTGDPANVAPGVRRAALEIDPSQPVYAVRSMEDVLARVLAPRRFQVMLLGGFAVAAVLLSFLGVYAVIAHAAAQRTREIGIRIALGGRNSDVLGLILRRALKLMLIGLVVGGVGAFAASRWLATMVFGVSPHDPVTLGGAALLLLAAGFIASYIPARRAGRVDPVLALRGD